MDIRLPSPVSLVNEHPGKAAGIRLFLKRDDLIHPQVQGNKWRKVSILFEKLQKEKVPGIITFGGAFSNYLHAVAYAGPAFGLKTVGVLRSLSADLNNLTLSDAIAQGMDLYPVSKNEYDLKDQSEPVRKLLEKYPGYRIIPEGGATADGVEGCKAISEEIRNQIKDIDNQLFIAVPAGTGCTAAGVLSGMQPGEQLLVFPAAVYGVSAESIKKMAGVEAADIPVHFIRDYTGVKFARPDDEIIKFAKAFHQKTGILPDPIYTSRMLFGLFDLLRRNYFPPGSTIVAIHTGGHQGWRGFDNM